MPSFAMQAAARDDLFCLKLIFGKKMIFFIIIIIIIIISSFHELMQSRGVRRPSVCLSVCLSVRLSVNFAQIATSTTEVAGSVPNLHTMVPRWACIQGVLKVKVKVKGHVIRALFCVH